MGKIENAASRTNLWTALFERAGKLANALGWEITPASIINAIWPVAAMVAGMIWTHVAWYFVVPSAVFLFGSLLHLYAGIKRALAVQGVKKASLADVAAACERASNGFFDFVEVRAQEVGDFSFLMNDKDWEEQRRLEDDFMRRLKKRIGGDVLAAVGMLAPLGIETSSDLRSFHWADRQARYFSALAKLLRDGHLEEARALDARYAFF